MKKIAILSTLILGSLSLALHAEATKLEGEATCAKCTLKQVEKCQAAVTVTKADGTKETYLADNNKVAKDFHETICETTEKVKAEGTVGEKDGKKTITLTKIEKL